MASAFPDLSLRRATRPDDATRAVVAPHRQRAATAAHRAAVLADATLTIEQRLADPDLTLQDIAHEVATSCRQLQRVSAKLAGSAFRDAPAAVRVQHGANLLQTTDLPAFAIARRVGYPSPRSSPRRSAATTMYHPPPFGARAAYSAAVRDRTATETTPRSPP